MTTRITMFVALAACVAIHTLDAQSLFWLDAAYASPKLGTANSDGSNARSVLLVPASLPEGLALGPGGSSLYWTDLAFTGSRIMTASTGLTRFTVIDSNTEAGRGIVWDSAGAKMYWAASEVVTGGTIFRSNYDGTGEETLQSYGLGHWNPRAVAIDPKTERVYWADFAEGTITRAGLNPGVPLEPLVSGLRGPVGLALDVPGGKMYWTEAIAGTIKCADLDGRGIVTLDSGLSVPNYIAVDASGGAMYWTDIGTPGIWRANIDGTHARLLGITVGHPTGIAVIPGSSTSVAGLSAPLPAVFTLSQNYPNPFNPSTTIRYGLPRRSNVVLSVFNALGQRVATLVNESEDAGYHDVHFNGSGVASGVYFYRMQAGSFAETKRFVFIR